MSVHNKVIGPIRQIQIFSIVRNDCTVWFCFLFTFQSYISCPVGIHMVGFVMAAHGATTPVVTLLFSRVVKHTGRSGPVASLTGIAKSCTRVVLIHKTRKL